MHDANWLLMCKKNKHEVLFHWKNEWRKTKKKSICQNEIIINGFSCLAHSTCDLNLKYKQKKMWRKKNIPNLYSLLISRMDCFKHFHFLETDHWDEISLSTNEYASLSLPGCKCFLFVFFLERFFLFLCDISFWLLKKTKQIVSLWVLLFLDSNTTCTAHTKYVLYYNVFRDRNCKKP